MARRDPLWNGRFRNRSGCYCGAERAVVDPQHDGHVTVARSRRIYARGTDTLHLTKECRTTQNLDARGGGAVGVRRTRPSLCHREIRTSNTSASEKVRTMSDE